MRLVALILLLASPAFATVYSVGGGGISSACQPGGSNNEVLTDDGSGGCASESGLTFDGTDLDCTTCIDTDDLADDSVTADKAEFNYAGSSSEGGAATTALALDADPADCSVSTQFADAIAADGDLTCRAIVDADVPDDITIDLAATCSALASDPAPCSTGQYVNDIDADGTLTCAALPDGTGTANTIAKWSDTNTLTDSSCTDDGSALDCAPSTEIELDAPLIDLAPNQADVTSANDEAMLFSASFRVNGTTTLFAGLNFEPSVSLGGAASQFGGVAMVRSGGTFDTDDTDGNPSNVQLFLDENTYSSSVDDFPPGGFSFVDISRTTMTGSATSTGTRDHISLWAKFTIQNDSTGDYTHGNAYTILSQPQIDQNSSGALALTNMTHIRLEDINQQTGTATVTTQIGLDIEQMTKATTNIGVRNPNRTVYTPRSTTTLGASFTINPNSTFKRLETSGSASRTSSTTCITDGVDGQIIHILNSDSADTITLTDGTNCFLAGSANLALGPTDTVSLIFDGTAGVWYQIGASDN